MKMNKTFHTTGEDEDGLKGVGKDHTKVDGQLVFNFPGSGTDAPGTEYEIKTGEFHYTANMDNMMMNTNGLLYTDFEYEISQVNATTYTIEIYNENEATGEEWGNVTYTINILDGDTFSLNTAEFQYLDAGEKVWVPIKYYEIDPVTGEEVKNTYLIKISGSDDVPNDSSDILS